MRRDGIAITALFALILTVILGVATHAAVTLNDSGTEVVGIDLWGLSESVDEFSARERTAP